MDVFWVLSGWVILEENVFDYTWCTNILCDNATREKKRKQRGSDHWLSHLSSGSFQQDSEMAKVNKSIT